MYLTSCPAICLGSSSRDAPPPRHAPRLMLCDLGCSSLARLPGPASRQPLESASRCEQHGRRSQRLACWLLRHRNTRAVSGFRARIAGGVGEGLTECVCAVLTSRVDHQQQCSSASKVWYQLRSVMASAGSWAARSPQLQPQLSTVAQRGGCKHARHGHGSRIYKNDTVSLLRDPLPCLIPVPCLLVNHHGARAARLCGVSL